MKKRCEDHLGNKYNSIQEMCDAHGIDIRIYRARLRYGWTTKRALTEKKEITDHKGKHYKSTSEMCREYHISLQLYEKRRENGMSMQEALETEVSRTIRKGKKIKDHCGNAFPSVNAMCRYYHISQDNYYQRIRSGWSVEDALAVPIRDNRARAYICEETGTGVCDHEGNRFNTVEDMCNYHNIPKALYYNRKWKGWSLEQRLAPSFDNKKQCQDHLGNFYKSLKDMCETYHVSYPQYLSRRRIGWSLERSLTEPIRKKKKKGIKIVKYPQKKR